MDNSFFPATSQYSINDNTRKGDYSLSAFSIKYLVKLLELSDIQLTEIINVV